PRPAHVHRAPAARPAPGADAALHARPVDRRDRPGPGALSRGHQAAALEGAVVPAHAPGRRAPLGRARRADGHAGDRRAADRAALAALRVARLTPRDELLRVPTGIRSTLDPWPS